MLVGGGGGGGVLFGADAVCIWAFYIQVLGKIWAMEISLFHFGF